MQFSSMKDFRNVTWGHRKGTYEQLFSSTANLRVTTLRLFRFKCVSTFLLFGLFSFNYEYTVLAVLLNKSNGAMVGDVLALHVVVLVLAVSVCVALAIELG
jgi:hypothetical protein